MTVARKTRSKYAAPGCNATWMAPIGTTTTSIRHACHWHCKDTKECVCPCGARHLEGQKNLFEIVQEVIQNVICSACGNSSMTVNATTGQGECYRCGAGKEFEADQIEKMKAKRK